VAFVRTNVSEELRASVIRVMMEALNSSVTSLLRRDARRNITEDVILQVYRKLWSRQYGELKAEAK
jgi:hypothetical protein